MAAIDLPDDVKGLAESLSQASGYASVTEYVRALILADAREQVSPELETHLLKAVATPAIEVTPEYWEQKKRKLSGAIKSGE